MTIRNQIYDRVLSFIHNPDPARFEPLALEVFRHQFATVDAYRRYCLSLSVTPESIRSLDEIPAVSALAFKYADLASANDERLPGGLTFLTSGTTAGRDRRGRHRVPRPEIYRASAIAHLGAMMFPDRRRMTMLAIHPTADLMPESSLSQMISWGIEEFGNGTSRCAAGRGGVDTRAAIAFLRDAESHGEPVCIFGTTAAFAAIFRALDELGVSIQLAPASRLMDTGGAKGQVVALEASQIASLAAARLSIAADYVINEYGMTELCSQLYDATPFNMPRIAASSPRVKMAPPWLRASAIDPATCRRLGARRPGLLRFFDLANVGSVSAVMTEDIGIVENDRIRVLGRASAAEARGCALALVEFASAADGGR
ncbi:MAG TPA: hypothetical protein VIX59_20010 [Candidatus Binataceae bacterium]